MDVRNNSNDIYALSLKRIEVVDDTGEMGPGAAGCEGAGDGKESNLLVLPVLGGIEALGNTDLGDFGELVGVGDPPVSLS